MVEKRDYRATQRFDVVIRETKTVVYSKMKENLGWPKGDEKKELIVKRIEAELDKLDAIYDV